MREIHKSNKDKRLERENIKLIGQIQGYEDSKPDIGTRKRTGNLRQSLLTTAVAGFAAMVIRRKSVIRVADFGTPV